MNGYEKRTDKKKKAIVDAARRLFSERGIVQVSISEIAKSAQVSQVSIYNYFGDKNALAKEAFLSYIEEAIGTFERIIDSDMPFLEKLELIMHNKNDIVEIASIHFDEQIWEDKVLQQIFQEAVKEKTVNLYAKFIEAGKKAGTINADIPTDAIMTYFVMSLSILQRLDFHLSSVEYKKGIMELFLYGLLGRSNKGEKSLID